MKPTDLTPPFLGLRNRPSPLCEGDHDQRWSDLGCITHLRFIFLSLAHFIFPFFPFLTTRSDGSKSPPPPLPLPTFRFTSHPSDLALYSGDRLEVLGDSSLYRPLFLLSAQIYYSSERRDPRRLWMIGGHRTWRLLPDRLLIDPTFGFDSLKLFLKNPHHTRIAWHLLPWQTRFDLVVYLVGSTAPNLMLFRTLIAVVALVTFWMVVKSCVDLCFCCCNLCVCCFCWCCCCCSNVDVGMLLCFATLFVGPFAVTYVTLSSLDVGFYLPLCRVM